MPIPIAGLYIAPPRSIGGASSARPGFGHPANFGTPRQVGDRLLLAFTWTVTSHGKSISPRKGHQVCGILLCAIPPNSVHQKLTNSPHILNCRLKGCVVFKTIQKAPGFPERPRGMATPKRSDRLKKQRPIYSRRHAPRPSPIPSKVSGAIKGQSR